MSSIDEVGGELSPEGRARAEEHRKRLNPDPSHALPISPNAPTREEILLEKIAAMRAFVFKDMAAGTTRDPG